MERLEDRRLLAGNLDPWHNAADPFLPDVTGEMLSAPSDGMPARQGLSGEGEDPKAVRISARLTTNAALRYAAIPGAPNVKIWWPVIDVTDVIYSTRTDLITANPGDTILLNVFAEDIRTDDGLGPDGNRGPYTDADGDGIDDTDDFGVYAVYLDATYEAGAFVVAQGTSNNPIKSFDFPINFGNPRDVTSFDDGLDPPEETLATEHYNYPNGPSGDASVPGLIDEAGGFSNLSKPVGHVLDVVPADQKYIFNVAHVFSVPFVVQSYITGNHDGGSVAEGQSKELDPLSAVQMVGSATGEDYSFNVNPAENSALDVLVFGAVGEPGTGGTGSVVDATRIDWVGDSVKVVNNRTLTITKAALVAPQYGTVQLVNNKLVYTPTVPVTAPVTDTFVYQFTDDVTTSSATVTVAITPVNDTPTLNPINNVTVDEDPGEVTVALSGIAAGGTENQPLQVTAVSSSPTLIANIAVGYTAPNTAGTLTFTPALNRNGRAVVTVTVTDGGLDNDLGTTGDNGTTSQTFTVTVNAVNDPPVNALPSEPLNTTADTPLAFTGASSIGVSDPDGDVTVAVTAAVDGGVLNVTGVPATATLHLTGTVTAVNVQLATLVFTPPAGVLNQTYTLTVSTNDQGNTGTAPGLTDGPTAGQDLDTVAITVIPPGYPYAVDDARTVSEDPAAAVALGVLGNDLGRGTVTITQVTGAGAPGQAVTTVNGGTVTVVDGGVNVTYQPAANYNGPDSFTYTIQDLAGPPDAVPRFTACVSINVTPVNDGPTLDVPFATMATDEDTPVVMITGRSITVADADADDNGGGVTVTATVAHGTLDAGTSNVTLTGVNTSTLTISGLVGAVDTSLQTLTYTPVTDYVGSDALHVVVDDAGNTGGGAETDSRSVAITVNPINDPPVLNPIGDRNVDEETPLQFTVATGVAPDTVTLSASGLPAGATFISATGEFRWTPSEMQGPASYQVTFTATDKGRPHLSDSETITITVAEVNVPPSVAADHALVTVSEGQTAGTVGTWSDKPGESGVVTLTTSLGTVTRNADGTWDWSCVPPDGPASSTVTITADDGVGGVSTAGFTLAVTNTAPTLVLGGAGIVPDNLPYELTLATTDPGIDAINSWAITWGDGVVETVAGNPPTAPHSYPAGVHVYTVTATATDEDGTYTAANTHDVRVISGDAQLLDGVLYIAGTPGKDTVTVKTAVSQGATVLQVGAKFLPGGKREFPAATVVRLQVTLGDSNDSLKLYPQVLQPALVFGDGGNDQVTAGGGPATVYGGAGNDQLTGGLSRVTLYGEAGNDTLNGGAQSDVLDGGEGTDRLYGKDGDDTLNGGGGADQLSGGNGHDQLNGDDGDDKLKGEAGNDVLQGGAGNDQLTGGTGDDELHGGDGNDTLKGEAGSDKLWGDAGKDQLTGGADNDQLDGGDGDDQLKGEAGNDVLVAGLGNDQLSGGNDNDQLDSGGGDDKLNGDAGNDGLVAGLGNDQLSGGGGNDQLDGGDDNDTLKGDAGNDLLQGGAGNDQLWGGTGDDELHGGDDNDTLKGDAGIDKLWGDADADALWGGGGADELRGGSGTDVLYPDKYDTVKEEEPPPVSSPAWFPTPEGEDVGPFERAIAPPAADTAGANTLPRGDVHRDGAITRAETRTITNRRNDRWPVAASEASAELPILTRTRARVAADFPQAVDDLFGEFDAWDGSDSRVLLPR